MLALAGTVTLGANAPSVGAQSSSACGPPHYCARTDRETVPYPAAAPVLGPAGSVISDPDFHSSILRVTDASSNPQRPGDSFHTAASSEQNTWNTTATKFLVGDSGGASYQWDFDPAHMKARQVGALKTGWGGAEFSYSQPDILYGITRRRPVFQQFDLRSGKISTVHDPASCVRLNPSDFGAGLSVSADDNRVMAVMGPEQDKNYLVYVLRP